MPLMLRVKSDVLADIDNLAGAANMDRSEFIKMWLGTIANLKREYAQRAIADIPLDRFKVLPGRPRGSLNFKGDNASQ